jgi:ADP-ribose pyrophosphatase
MGERIKTTVIHEGTKFDFVRLDVTETDGSEYSRDVVRHPGAVCVLGLLEGGRVLLIRNYRVAVGSWEWELPAGTLEKGEDPAQCAIRELEEETGYRADRLESLGTFLTTPGMTDELMHAYLATGLRETETALEDGERIETDVKTADEALAMVDSGEMRDGKSMLTLLIAQRRGLLRRDGTE